MRLSAYLYFSLERLRTHPLQELFAGVGIAIGVALVFAVQVANTSITDSAAEVGRGVAGAANLQLSARDSRGLNERFVERVRDLPGVERAAPMLEQPGTIIGPRGRGVALTVASVDPSLVELSGALTSSPLAGAVRDARGIFLPSATADAIELPRVEARRIARPASTVVLRIRGQAVRARVDAVLGKETIGVLSDARAAIVPLPYLQAISGLQGRVTRILVEAAPGREKTVQAALTSMAAGRLTVGPADRDVRLLEQAVTPNDQATALFAAISALVGLLLVFNAMLLTAPERRRTIAELRIQGFRPRQLVQLVLFHAAALGLAGALVGLVAGVVLSKGLLRESPDYLAAAFPLGTQTVVTLEPVLIAVVGGILATCAAAAPPLLDLRRNRAVEAVYFEGGEPGEALDPRARRALLLAAACLLVVTTVLFAFVPAAALIACVALAAATLLAVPSILMATVAAGEWLADHWQHSGRLTIALSSLRAATLSSLGLAAIGAVAVFGSVAVEGGREDLLQGLYGGYGQYVDTADLWIVNDRDDLATHDFAARRLPAKVADVPGVASARPYFGGFLDRDDRRLWLIGRPSADRAMIAPSQIVDGSTSLAQTRLRADGWITVSDQVADAEGIVPGDSMTLPTPAGERRYRVAATTTNLGWPAGAVAMNSDDYREAFPAARPTAIEVDLRPGADATAVASAIRVALGDGNALQVQTAGARATQANALARQGLGRLQQISILLLVAAGLAMAAAMGAAIWQRRPGLAALRLQSVRPSHLRRILMIESGIVLAAGCLTGALAGVYGQALIDRSLRLTTGFPAPFSIGWQALLTFAAVVAITLAGIAVPGYLASRTPPRLGLQE